MILVVADTGPINYLVQIGCIDLLPKLADFIVLPEFVRAELLHPKAPLEVRIWADALPSWVQVRSARPLLNAPDLSDADREGIALAKELHATALLMDDQQGRQVARSHGVATMGTIGLLEAAAARNLIEIAAVLERLRETSFYVSEDLLREVLDRDVRRRQSRS